MYACVSVLGVRVTGGLAASVEGIGWVMRECSDEVRLGMVSEGSPWSVVPGRSRVDGRMKDGWSLRVGDMAAVERSPGGGGERALGADEDDDDDGRGEKEEGRGKGGRRSD